MKQILKLADYSKLLHDLDVAAASPWAILLLGETGVGKELLARRVHEKSLRNMGPFIPVNCAAINPNLFESEFFGHERGSFSGAHQNYRGLVRFAHCGTLFLDELGELPHELQAKLLRFLDSGEVRSVGGARFEKVDVRIVAATNRDLKSASEDGSFRLDLLERLSVFRFRIPPLRERPEHLLLVAEELAEELQIKLADSARTELLRFEWPGNIRQLKNILIRCGLYSSGVITSSMVRQVLDAEASQHFCESEPNIYEEGSLAEAERQWIIKRLRACRGNRKRAAEELGIAKSTLHEKLRKWKEQGMVVDSTVGVD